MKPDPNQPVQPPNPGFAHPAQPVVSVPEAGRGAGGGGDYNNGVHKTVRVSHDRGESPAVSQQPATITKK
jgi:hypothetical protein